MKLEPDYRHMKLRIPRLFCIALHEMGTAREWFSWHIGFGRWQRGGWFPPVTWKWQ